MIEITVIDVESKELHKMEETKEKETKETETKEKMKLSTIRIMVISEACQLIIRHKKKVMQVDPLIYYFYYILFLLSKCQLRDRFTRLLHLHEKLTREYVCVRACVCVRTYIGVAVI